MGQLSFVKYEGLGNDFVLIEASDEREVPPEQAARLCDRRLGVGADGVLLLLPSRTADCAVRMRVLNADGSVPEMCGNGARCVALHWARSRRTPGATVPIDTDAGRRDCQVDDANGRGLVTVDMGVVRVLGDRTLDVGGRAVQLTAADAGNPHAVLFGDYARAEVEQLGPRIATHPDFPRGTNVEFVRPAAPAAGLECVVWERGVGLTLACGTGACAAAAAACARGLAAHGAPIAVRLPGGLLEITVDAAGRTTMRGPARPVFSGQVAVNPPRA